MADFGERERGAGEGERVRRPGLLRFIAQRALGYAAILAAILFLASFLLVMAEQSRQFPTARPLEALGPALERSFHYLFDHLTTYQWHREEVSAVAVVSGAVTNSLGLLGASLGVAIVIGSLLGLIAALARSKASSTLIMLLSTLGTSTPSFLLAMIFWLINIRVHRAFAIQVLPSVGFGWDAHMVMPTLVLAMRPLAQIAQVVYVSLSDVLRQDYIRTARAKGLSWRMMRNDHAFRNILIPLLTTAASSLRFSLASLPVVELFFYWPGVGVTLLIAAFSGDTVLATDLLLSLGAVFLVVNLLVEIAYPLIDPRLREEQERSSSERRTWRERFESLRAWLRGWRRERPGRLPALPVGSGEGSDRPDFSRAHRAWYARSFFGTPVLLAGILLTLFLLFLIAAGGRLAQANPYELHGVSYVDGVLSAPPYAPSEAFPWGTDQFGRDMQALVLYGARQTLMLALFCTLARMALGILIGALAGWWRNGWFDRLMAGAVGVWAAFPITLFAILIIQAIGIQRGIWVFVAALSLVGWGEVAQFVRAQVISIRTQPYIEAARSVGAGPRQLLGRHVVPNLFNHLIVLSVFELGAVLMLLAELGFLNVFVGGGFGLELGDAAGARVSAVSFSDVPEWAAMVATGRIFWRNSPWITWYPAGAFFLSIMTFNLLGEGLRRFLEDSQANLSRLFNRYTLAGAAVLAALLAWFFYATNPLGVYTSESRRFETAAALRDADHLSAAEYAGREAGTEGQRAAAEYIGQRMEEAGLLPLLLDGGYVQAVPLSMVRLTAAPALRQLDAQGAVVAELTYRRDFAELVGEGRWGSATGPVVGLAFGPAPEDGAVDPYRLGELGLSDSIVLVRSPGQDSIPAGSVAGVLVVSDDPAIMLKRYLYPQQESYDLDSATPFLYITAAAADRLLAESGSSLADLDRRAGELAAGEAAITAPGAIVSVDVPAALTPEGTQEYNVIGILPGTGATQGLDRNVIIVSAYYDGLGTGVNGAIYPGANDNASGVGVLLEIARRMAESPYDPKKTVLFVVWSGGERGRGLDVPALMSLRGGMERWTVEAVIELSGVGAGEGSAIAIGGSSSPRLAELFEAAAARLYTPAHILADPHAGMYAGPLLISADTLTLALGWEGTPQTLHTNLDGPGVLDPEKLGAVGRSAYLTVIVLSRETDY